MSEQLTLTGAQRRDVGMATVDGNADDRWRFEMDCAIRHLARKGRPFTADDVPDWLRDTAHHPSAISARFLAAVRSGLIVDTGRTVRSRRPEAHARRLVVYRGASRA